VSAAEVIGIVGNCTFSVGENLTKNLRWRKTSKIELSLEKLNALKKSARECAYPEQLIMLIHILQAM
jgi:hypothetical protein